MPLKPAQFLDVLLEQPVLQVGMPAQRAQAGAWRVHQYAVKPGQKRRAPAVGDYEAWTPDT